MDPKTQSLTLPRPITAEGIGTVSELTFREPTVADLEDLSLLDMGAAKLGFFRAVAERIATPRLPPEVWAGMSLANGMAVVGVVGGFFSDLEGALGGLMPAPEAGSPSPPSAT